MRTPPAWPGGDVMSRARTPIDPATTTPSMGLPVDDHMEGLLERLGLGDSPQLDEPSQLVLVAEPGAGKTTRLPPALADRWRAAGGSGRVIVTQPRRIAAQLAAARVAANWGDELGRRCGYSVRFERALSEHSEVEFTTEGLLLRRLIHAPSLPGVHTVILDEFHERQVEADLLLGLLAHIRKTRRPELRIVVMSATMDPRAVSEFIGGSPIEIPGRTFPVETIFEDRHRDRPLPQRVLRTIHAWFEDPSRPRGDVLVFLPGKAAIRACEAALSGYAQSRELGLEQLHGDLGPKLRDRVLAPSDQPRVILSTNIAETSVTLPGVVLVVDSGYAHTPRHDPASGRTQLIETQISRASARQRSGRAGRTRAGVCVHLYARHDHDLRPAYDEAQINRSDLSGPLLAIAGVVTKLEQFRWFESPPKAALNAAYGLLESLGALEQCSGSRRLTPMGRAMLDLPLHPRHARFWLACMDLGLGNFSHRATAVLAESRLRLRDAESRAGHHDADLLAVLDDLERAGSDARRQRNAGLDPAACKTIERVRSQLSKIGRGHRSTKAHAHAKAVEREPAICRALLLAHPDRVARLEHRDPSQLGAKRGQRAPDSGRIEVHYCRGGTAQLDPSSQVGDHEWIVAVETLDHKTKAAKVPLVASAAAIDTDWLIDEFPDLISERERIEFDTRTKSVRGRSELLYGNLVIDASDSQHIDPELAADCLARAALAAGLAQFVDMAALQRLAARTQFVVQYQPDLAGHALRVDDETLVRHVRAACVGQTSFRGLARAGLLQLIHGALGPLAHQLDTLAPTHLRLPTGRKAEINYEDPSQPYVASRLQDFFGLDHVPRVGSSPVELTLHLLAPNRRPVQVTRDLAGFWREHYPELRKTLMRRYPRHAWPEDPYASDAHEQKISTGPRKPRGGRRRR